VVRAVDLHLVNLGSSHLVIGGISKGGSSGQKLLLYTRKVLL